MRLRERYKRLTLWNKLGTLGAVASIIGITLTVLFWAFPRSSPDAVPTPAPMPDVGLTFHRPESPQFRVRNLSDYLVREPKYQFLIYDLDLPGTDEPYLNLRIPVKVLEDYVRPRSILGPWRLMSLSTRGSRVQPGHRLFGFAQVECPNCVNFRHYWVFFHVGRSGWFSEIPASEKPAQIPKRITQIIYGPGSPLDAIDEVIPSTSRVAVR